MSITAGRDGSAYPTIAAALAALPVGEQVWLDGQELTRTEAEYMAAHEQANATPDPATDA